MVVHGEVEVAVEGGGLPSPHIRFTIGTENFDAVIAVQVYNPGHNRWLSTEDGDNQISRTPAPRDDAAAAHVPSAGCFFVARGESQGEVDARNEAFIYDPFINQWKTRLGKLRCCYPLDSTGMGFLLI